LISSDVSLVARKKLEGLAKLIRRVAIFLERAHVFRVLLEVNTGLAFRDFLESLVKSIVVLESDRQSSRGSLEFKFIEGVFVLIWG